MTWENYGRIENVRCWHLDHKVPAFYKENEDDNQCGRMKTYPKEINMWENM